MGAPGFSTTDRTELPLSSSEYWKCTMQSFSSLYEQLTALASRKTAGRRDGIIQCFSVQQFIPMMCSVFGGFSPSFSTVLIASLQILLQLPSSTYCPLWKCWHSTQCLRAESRTHINFVLQQNHLSKSS